MTKKTIDTTKESNEAQAASDNFDAAQQFSVPNIVRWLKIAYYHGYRDALIKERSVGKEGGRG